METFSALLAICAVNSTHKGQWCGALMLSLTCAWINAWVNNLEVGDLRRRRAHYNVTVLVLGILRNHKIWTPRDATVTKKDENISIPHSHDKVSCHGIFPHLHNGVNGMSLPSTLLQVNFTRLTLLEGMEVHQILHCHGHQHWIHIILRLPRYFPSIGQGLLWSRILYLSRGRYCNFIQSTQSTRTHILLPPMFHQ